MTAADEIVAQAPSDNIAQLSSNLNRADDNQLQVTLNCHSIGNSSASSASSSSLSPPNQSCSTPHNVSQASSPSSSNTTLKNLAQPNLLAAESNNAPKSETCSVTPQNSRFIIKKIPQAELEKYKNTPNHQKTNNSTATRSSSRASDSQNSSDKSSAANKEQSPDNAANTASEATKEPVKKQNTERKINKFTVKKVIVKENLFQIKFDIYFNGQ